MNPITDTIEKALKEDPIATAERLTGRRSDYSVTNPATALGFALSIKKCQEMEGLMILTDDTTFSTTWKNFLRIMKSEGFDVVLREPIKDQEEWIIAWHPDGLLIFAESFSGAINRADMFYNLQIEEEKFFHVVSSGCLKNNVLVGSHSLREAFRHTLQKLRSNGTFLPKWTDQPHFWFVDWSHKKLTMEQYDAITQSRLERLPDHIQQAISGKPSSTTVQPQ